MKRSNKKTTETKRTKLTVNRDVLRRLSDADLAPVWGGGNGRLCCATSASGN
jgi:hypothetical protein